MNLAAITIICGACHCAPAAADVKPCEYQFVMTQPKVWSLQGTSLTITYDLRLEAYTIQDGDAQSSATTPEDAEQKAIDMVRRLRSVGVTP
jgi:hypothetical protein